MFDLLDRNVYASRELVARELAADGWDAAKAEKVAHSAALRAARAADSAAWPTLTLPPRIPRGRYSRLAP